MNKEKKAYHAELIAYYTKYMKDNAHIPPVKAAAEARISALKKCKNKCGTCCIAHVCEYEEV